MTARMLAALAVPAVLALAPSSSTGQATVTLPANPQQTPVVTAADYARAERFLRENTMPLVSGLGVQPTWLAGDRFGYRITTRGQSQFILVNPSKGTRIACSPETDRCGGALDPREVSRLAPPLRPPGRPESRSPNGMRATYIRDYNLWVRDIATGRETQLTTDGQKDFGYATDNAGWVKSDRPVLVWSPDSRKIATFQQDDRPVGEMYLVTTKVGHPELQQWKYPLPGDSAISMISRVVINVDTPRVIRFQMPPDAHRSTLCDHVICRGTEWADVEWYPDGSHIAFVSTSRDHKHEVFRVADAATGSVRDVFREDV
ncbi:MAG TPA: DPP IV N-terminal domain-containing protein, partial [Gemmatimonadaceae bacterium]